MPVVARLILVEKVIVFVGGVLMLEFDIAVCKLNPSVTGYVAAFKMEHEVKQIVVVSKFFQDIKLLSFEGQITQKLLILHIFSWKCLQT